MEGGSGNKELEPTNSEDVPVTHQPPDSDQKDNAHQDHDRDRDDPISEADATGLVDVLQNDAGVDILQELKGHYEDDTLFKSILENRRTLGTSK